MNAQPDDFEQLRKLLALKRHEIPPPGYFHSFSDNVIARLQAPQPAARPSWLQLLGLDFDLRPAFLCGAGVAVCALLSLGIIAATQIDTQDGTIVQVASNVDSPISLPLNPVAVLGAGSVQRPEEAPASTAPVLHGSANAGSPFSQFPGLKVQRASFPLGGQ
jgi:hypothetical protein